MHTFGLSQRMENIDSFPSLWFSISVALSVIIVVAPTIKHKILQIWGENFLPQIMGLTRPTTHETDIDRDYFNVKTSEHGLSN